MHSFKGEIGRTFDSKYLNHFSPEYQKAYALYEAQKRNWEIDYSDEKGLFQLKDSKDEITETYFDGQRVCCSCDDFFANKTGTCMHGEILKHCRIELEDEIVKSKKVTGICGLTMPVEGIEWQFWKRTDASPKRKWCSPEETANYRKMPSTDKFFQTKKTEFDEKDYGDVNVFNQITMRDYQVFCIKKMLRCKKTVTTLKMGLGKTVCAIATIALLNKDTNLIVCPASLKYQWQREIKKFLCIDAKLIMSKKDLMKYNLDAKPKITIINYELLGKLEGFLNKWDVTVIDEIQKVKNKETIAWKCLSGLNSEYIMALSGTVIENKVEDLISIIEILNPEELHPHWQFYSTFCKTSKIKVLGFKPEMMRELKTRFDRYIVNPIIDYTQFVVPNANYENHEVKWNSIEQQNAHNGPFESAKHLLAISQNRGLTFTEKIALNGLLVKARLASSDIRLTNTSLAIASGNKTDKFAELIEDIVVKQNRKVVVYSDWIKMLKLAELELLKKGIGYIMYNGEQTLKKRNSNLDDFIGDPNCKVMLSTDTGGLGVDGLQLVSDAVIHLEMVWNPAKFDQRNGRVVRALNPNKQVDVHYIFTYEGVEIMMQSATIRKSGLRNEFFS